VSANSPPTNPADWEELPWRKLVVGDREPPRAPTGRRCEGRGQASFAGMDSQGFTEALARLRDRHGWPREGQTELAKLLGVDDRSVRRWVAGRPPPEPVARLVAAIEAFPALVGLLALVPGDSRTK
jgi:hypothetical protein